MNAKKPLHLEEFFARRHSALLSLFRPDTTEALFEASGFNSAVRACQHVLNFLGQRPVWNRLETLIKYTDWQDESANDRGRHLNWPARQTEQLVFVGHRTLLLKVPHEHVYEMGVLDGDGDLLEHVLESNGGLLQPVESKDTNEMYLSCLNRVDGDAMFKKITGWFVSLINKGRVHLNMNILSWFTHSHVIPDVYLSFQSRTRTKSYLNKKNPSLLYTYEDPKMLKLQKTHS